MYYRKLSAQTGFSAKINAETEFYVSEKVRKVHDKGNSVFEHDQSLMSFQVFKSYIATITFLYILRCLGYLLKVTSVLAILQTSV